MKRIIITAGTALLVAVPVSVGLLGNAASAQSAPVGVPSPTVMVDDHGGQSKHIQAGDDNGGLRKHTEAGDDNGGLRNQVRAGDVKGNDGPGHS